MELFSKDWKNKPQCAAWAAEHFSEAKPFSGKKLEN